MYTLQLPQMLQVKSELKNLLMSAYKVRRLIRRYESPDILQNIDPWGSRIEDYVVILYSRQQIGSMFIYPGKTHKDLKPFRRIFIEMDKRLRKFKYIKKAIRINKFLSSVDFIESKKTFSTLFQEFLVGFKSKLKFIVRDQIWRSLAFQWYNDITAKQYTELFNLQLRLSGKRKARNIRRKKYKANGYKRVALSVVEGCQTFGCQVTSQHHFGHPYHLVNPSILPFCFSLTLFCTIQTVLGLFMYEEFFNLISAFTHAYFIALNVAVIVTWLFEVFSEEQRGAHTLEVQQGFRYAILLFISSELMLFVSFF